MTNDGKAGSSAADAAQATSQARPARRMWASIDQAAGYFRVSKRTIEKLLSLGRIRAVRLGRCIRVDLVEIEQALEEIRSA